MKTITLARMRLAIEGAVQGVGFRPFVYRLAREMELAGWVRNAPDGVVIEVEGDRLRLDVFRSRVLTEKPAPALIQHVAAGMVDPRGERGFRIIESNLNGDRTAGIQPDLAPCPNCLSEIDSTEDRRRGYAFTNCTNCGPRYSILLDVPYDRPATTMNDFRMCRDCALEYIDPADRRFHAEPNACPSCGPQLDGTLEDAVRVLESGRILALKGVGGFQLLCDATNQDAVERLRERKQREVKPFALLMRDLETVERFCHVSPQEAALLTSPAAPIVLLPPRKVRHGIAPSVASCSPWLGVMLPASPLHHLLSRAFPHPVVATSGNLSDEPIATGNDEARLRLGSIADAFLTHNRPIARPLDDSVARIAAGRTLVLRRSRGYAPLPIHIGQDLPPLLAVGGHLKNTVAISPGRIAVLSQHIGDLDAYESRQAFERAIDDLCRLYRFKPAAIVRDLHPDYASSVWAEEQAVLRGVPVVAVQHHEAHVASVLAEHGLLEAECLGIAWDGTGFGYDGAIWGSEFFSVDRKGFRRVSHLRPFRLPGGDAAAREGNRCAAGLLAAAGLPVEDERLAQQLARGVNAPWTTSMGRLFDAVAALAGVSQGNRFEGEAGMRLESAIPAGPALEPYPFAIDPDGCFDWRPMLAEILKAKDPAVVAGRFHETLAQWILALAKKSGHHKVALSGGCFQNRWLAERAEALLSLNGFEVLTQRQVPPNDGGLALGQIVLGAKRLRD